MTSTPHRRFSSWISLAFVTTLAVVALVASSRFQMHADERRQIMVELGQIETLATAQSGVVWRALTALLVDDKHKFYRLRGEEQQRRTEIYKRIRELREREERSQAITNWLSPSAEDAASADGATEVASASDPEASVFDRIDWTLSAFLSGVQGTFGQLTLAPDRIRQRLDRWDMNFGQFTEALEELRARDEAIAAAASGCASDVSQGASLITLLACAMVVLRLSRVRAQRTRDLQEERLAAVRRSEARFRELVQNSSDLILVAGRDGSVRYATPSARVLVESLRSVDGDRDSAEEDSPHQLAADSLERVMEEDRGEGEPVCCVVVDAALGTSVDALIDAGRSEIVIQGAGGAAHTFDVQARDLTEESDIGGVVLNARDVTERKNLEDRLRHQALHDPLTNLPNRRCFQSRFESISDAQRDAASVLFLDLDGFKLVNDSYGHKVGDDLLRVVACRVRSCLSDDDVLARQGGDEFLILHHGDGAVLAQSIQDVLAPPFTLEDREIFVSASVGVVADVGSLDAEQAAQRADIAMYEAKREGKAQAIVFADEMLAGAPERLALESDFRRALERDEFTVVYQPKVGLQSGKIESLEALVRWVHPERGFVGPDQFIPFAEETGLISELGRIVLERACEDAVRWQDSGVVVAVNLSPVQFRNPDLVDEVAQAIESTGIDPSLLELEITESAVLGDVSKTIEVLDQLKALGCRLAIDDFGTGYSNLAHLKHFNVDVLKIDQAFVRGGGNPGSTEELSDGAIVQAVVGMAKAFGMHVVAEGVETVHHVDELRELGADLGQGYYFSKPVASEAIDRMLEAPAPASAT